MGEARSFAHPCITKIITHHRLTIMRNKSLNDRHQSQNHEHFTHWHSFLSLPRIFSSLYQKVPKPAPLNTPSLDMDSTHHYGRANHSKHALNGDLYLYLCHLPSRSGVLRLLFWCFIMTIPIQLSFSSPCNRSFKIANQHVRIMWHNQYIIVLGIITTVKECIVWWDWNRDG